MIARFRVAMTAVLIAVVATGCSPNAASSQAAAPLPAVETRAGAIPGGRIKHVVIVVQENRTFDNFFHAYPGADSASSGLTSTGATVPLTPIGFEKSNEEHDWQTALTDWDAGKMDGFDKNVLETGLPANLESYAYVKEALVSPYWAMAKSYVLGDRMFTTMFGQSFTAHLDLVAGTTNLSPTLAVVNDPTSRPWGCDAPAGTFVQTIDAHRAFATATPFPCFTQFRTMRDTLDAHNVSWRFYQPSRDRLWSSFDAIRNVRFGRDWRTNVGQSGTEILNDAAAGRLPAVSWVIPDWRNSDHASAGSDTGPSWVAAIVNSVGKGPDWNSTAIFVVWDDWGGWYDHVPPPQLSFDGLGIRVPVLVISPYAKKGYVSHTQYEFGSILKFAETVFGLPRLGPSSFGYTDTRANDMLDAFDFSQAPRAFHRIPAKYPTSYFFAQKPSDRPADDD